MLPTCHHFIATVDDLTDVLDYGSKDIDGMDDDADKEQGQDPPFTGRWTATSSYDVYMVDTPKGSGNDKEEPDTNKTSKTQSKRQRPKHRSKHRRSKDDNTGTGENSTPGDAENNEGPVGATSEQEHDSRQNNPDEQAIEDDSEDDSYRPPSEEETSLGNEDFIVPEDPLEQVDSYAPGHQVRFGSLNYMADIRGDFMFDGFEPMTAAPVTMMNMTEIYHWIMLRR